MVQRIVLLFYLILPGLLAVVCVTGRGMISSRWGVPVGRRENTDVPFLCFCAVAGRAIIWSIWRIWRIWFTHAASQPVSKPVSQAILVL